MTEIRYDDGATVNILLRTKRILAIVVTCMLLGSTVNDAETDSLSIRDNPDPATDSMPARRIKSAQNAPRASVRQSAESSGAAGAPPVDLETTCGNLVEAPQSNVLHGAGSTAPITGTLSGNVSLHGSVRNPAGQGTANLTQATVAGEPVQSEFESGIQP